MIVLVTGANRGLGLELIKEGIARGDVMIASYRSPENSSELFEIAKQNPENILTLRMDVSSEESIREAARMTETRFKYIDGIVNNAGILLESKYDLCDPIVNLDGEIMRKTIEVNTVGPALVLKHFMPFIYAAPGRPCVVNVTSEAGHLTTGLFTYLAYGVSKHGSNMYTQKIVNYLRSQPDKAHIRVFMLHPGRMNTVMGREYKQIEPDVPAKGIFDILEGKIDPKLDIPFVDYKGNQLAY